MSILLSLIAVWSLLDYHVKSDVEQQSENQLRYTVKGDCYNKTVKLFFGNTYFITYTMRNKISKNQTATAFVLPQNVTSIRNIFLFYLNDGLETRQFFVNKMLFQKVKSFFANPLLQITAM